MKLKRVDYLQVLLTFISLILFHENRVGKYHASNSEQSFKPNTNNAVDANMLLTNESFFKARMTQEREQVQTSSK